MKVQDRTYRSPEQDEEEAEWIQDVVWWDPQHKPELTSSLKVCSLWLDMSSLLQVEGVELSDEEASHQTNNGKPPRGLTHSHQLSKQFRHLIFKACFDCVTFQSWKGDSTGTQSNRGERTGRRSAWSYPCGQRLSILWSFLSRMKYHDLCEIFMYIAHLYVGIS